MSLKPKTANILNGSGAQNFGTDIGNNSNLVVSALTMNPNVLNNNFQCAPTTPLTTLPLASVLSPSVNNKIMSAPQQTQQIQIQQQQAQPQQFYQIIPIAGSGVSTLQLGGARGLSAAVANVPQCNAFIQNKMSPTTSVHINNQNSRISTNIAQIIGTTLPIQNVVAATNVMATVGAPKNYGAAIAKSNAPGLPTVVQTGMVPAISAASATIIQLPTGTANLQRVIAPTVQAATANAVIAAGQTQAVPIATMSAAGTFSIITPNINSKFQTSQFVINSGAPKSTTTTTTTATKIIEIKSTMDMDRNMTKAVKPITTATTPTTTVATPMQQQAKAAIAQNPLLQKLQNICQEAIESSSASVVIAPNAVLTSSTQANNRQKKTQIDEINLQKLLPETTITKEPLISNTANNNSKEVTTMPLSKDAISIAVDISSETEADPFDDLDKSDDMLVIDDSSEAESSDDDDERKENDNVNNAAVENVANNVDNDARSQGENNNVVLTTKSPPRIRHISNSVVLTKADTSRGHNNLRSLNSEPAANVVLMKLPNAMQQSSGGVKAQNVTIPINEALSMAKQDLQNKTSQNNESKSMPIPVALIRSNSLPKGENKLSPRANKRSQSLNCSAGGAIGINNDSVFNLQAPTTAAENLNKSSDDLNKSNPEITFIQLDDDSFDEDYSDDGDEKKIIADVDKYDNLKTQNNSVKKKAASTIDKGDLNKNQNIHAQDNSDEQILKSLLCNEQITATASSSSSSSSLKEISPKMSANNSRAKLANQRQLATSQSQVNVKTTTATLPPPTTSSSSSSAAKTAKIKNAHYNTAASSSATVTTPNPNARRICRENNIASSLSMVSTFDMLNWKDGIGAARGTGIRFELNEFNLLQLHERNCPPRYRIHNSYERPISERSFALTPKSDQADPVLYMCRKCKAYGPAVDFLAPEFCSYVCLRRTNIKRVAQTNPEVADTYTTKRSRKNLPSTSSTALTTSGNNSNNNANNQTRSSTPYATASVSIPKFHWSTYLAAMRSAYTAPIDLFLNPFPTGPNPFSVGMKLEAIDPENCSLFCVCTVAQIQGYRMRLTFDGYDSVYDFWTNADSMDIFPPGWCEKTKRTLQPPGNYNAMRTFYWGDYLRKLNAQPAEKKLFTHLNGDSTTSATMNNNPFKVGMFLEADDLNDTGKLCVASVADVLDERIRVHFDGWDDCYDYWVDISSPYIHPCGWHEGRQQLLVPPEYGNTSFSWREYIKDSHTGGIAAPEDFFVPRDPIDYRPGMKLEVVDPQNPSLIRPATVVHRTRHRIKIHFDCWPIDYTFVLEDDSPDLHPIGWCEATGHELEPPPGYLQFQEVMPCNTNGCRGIGNMNRNNGRSHATREACPYTLENWRNKCEKTPRVEGKQIIRGTQAYQQQQPQKEEKLKVTATTTSPTTVQQQQQEHIKPASRGRPRKAHRKVAPAAQQADLLTSDQIKEEINSNSECNLPAPIVPQIKIEAVVSNGISAHKLNTQAHLEPQTALIKRFLCDYGPRLEQNYALWRENLTSCDISSKVQRNPLLWTTGQVCDFFKNIFLEKSQNLSCDLELKLSKHDIDGEALLMLQQQDLMDTLELKLGTAVKICSIILQLRILAATKCESSDSSDNSKNSNFDSEIGNDSASAVK